MKTRTIQLTAMLMILTISVFAAPKAGDKKTGITPTNISAAEIVQRDVDHVTVWIDKTAETTARIIITDADGNEVYSRKIESPDTMKITHDISAFPKGKYSICIFVKGKCIASADIAR